MRNSLTSPSTVAFTFCGFLALTGGAMGQVPGNEMTRHAITVQSELDYLRAAKTKFTIDLRQVTIRQAYEEIARKTGIGIAYEGGFDEEAKHDVHFASVTLKEMLGRLGQRFNLSYRVDGPEKLTVIGPSPR